MMGMTFGSSLSRRERQIMDILYQRGRAAAAEVMDALPGSPSNSAVRMLLRILEEKGHVRHIREGTRYVYLPVQPRQSAARSVLKQVLQTFFGGSVEKAVATLLSAPDARLSEAELDRLAALIARAKEGSP
jgi:predicted transcriptional regulator